VSPAGASCRAPLRVRAEAARRTARSSRRPSRRPPERLAHLLLGRERIVDLAERAVGVDHVPAERDERVARLQPLPGRDAGLGRAQPVLELQHHPLRGLAADPRDRLEAREVVARDRAPELRGRRPGDDRKRHLGADPGDAEQQLEEIALVGRGKTVELEGVLANMGVNLDRRLRPDARRHARCGGDEIADPADIDQKARGRACGNGAAQARDHGALPGPVDLPKPALPRRVIEVTVRPRADDSCIRDVS